MEREFSIDRALKEVDGIASLETARITLRWALERLRLLESRLDTAESRARDATASAESSIRQADALKRERDSARKEEQRAKALAVRLEARFAELGRGGQTAAAQARAEAELLEREEALKLQEERRRELAESDRLTIEQEARAARDRADREAKAQLALEREEFHKAQARSREEIAARYVSLHEEEVRLRVRQKALEERAAALESRGEAHRLELEKAAAAQAALLHASTRSHVDSEIAALQEQWSAERKLLLDELNSWRGRARSMIPEIVTLGDRLHVVQEEDSTLKISLDRLREDLRRAEESLREERDQRRVETRELAAVRETAADHARHVEELQGSLRAQTRRLEDAARSRDEMAAALSKREEALVKLEDNITARLLDAEKLLISRYDAWVAHENANRRQGNAWLSGIEERRSQAEAALEQIGRLRRELIDEIEKRRTP